MCDARCKSKFIPERIGTVTSMVKTAICVRYYVYRQEKLSVRSCCKIVGNNHTQLAVLFVCMKRIEFFNIEPKEVTGRNPKTW